MKCPYCYYDETKVTDTRESGNITRRRRECLKCEKRFTTYEHIETLALRVIKKDGNIEAFDRNKILKGILKACEKRPVKMEKIQRVVEDIEVELRKQDNTEIPSKKIGELVMAHLKKLDKVAYIRFASVYREFKDLKSFEKEIKKVITV